MPVLAAILPRLAPWTLSSRAYSIFSAEWATGRPTRRPAAPATARALQRVRHLGTLGIYVQLGEETSARITAENDERNRRRRR
jgi:hypothetical protein